jgi:hypothetical protein
MIKMNPKDESKSLQEYPLPTDAMDFSACKTDMVLSTIAYLDEAIEAMTGRQEYYRKQRDLLLNRALKEGIERSGGYILITTPENLKRNRITDINAFTRKFPVGYLAVRRQQSQNLLDKFNRDVSMLENSEIPLTIADAKIGKDLVTEFTGYQPQAMTVEVRRLPEALR